MTVSEVISAHRTIAKHLHVDAQLLHFSACVTASRTAHLCNDPSYLLIRPLHSRLHLHAIWLYKLCRWAHVWHARVHVRAFLYIGGKMT